MSSTSHMKNEKQADDRIRTIIKKIGTPKPSENFTGKVMKEVFSFENEHAASPYNKPAFKSAFKPVFAYMAAFLMTIVTAVFYFRMFPGQLENLNFFSTDNPVWNDTREGFVTIFSSLHLSPLTLLIVGSIIVLVLLDILLKRIYPKKFTFFFTF